MIHKKSLDRPHLYRLRASSAQFLAFECNFKVAHEPTPLVKSPAGNDSQSTPPSGVHQQLSSQKTTSGRGPVACLKLQKFRVKLERVHAKNHLGFA